MCEGEQAAQGCRVTAAGKGRVCGSPSGLTNWGCREYGQGKAMEAPAGHMHETGTGFKRDVWKTFWLKCPNTT